MGVENYLITSSVVAILAQRLVRLICAGCRESAGRVMNPWGEHVDAFHGRGCQVCNGSGYKGRAGIFELMELNEEIRELVMARADASKLTDAARRNGMHQLREDGWMKVKQGVTTAEEVTRVTQEF
jgi:type II secretory ATPase GspE/PulE/Tfp pilus assembly ATPase PilB-like protein